MLVIVKEIYKWNIIIYLPGYQIKNPISLWPLVKTKQKLYHLSNINVKVEGGKSSEMLFFGKMSEQTAFCLNQLINNAQFMFKFQH